MELGRYLRHLCVMQQPNMMLMNTILQHSKLINIPWFCRVKTIRSGKSMLICQMFVQQFSPDTSLCGKNHDEFTWAFRGYMIYMSPRRKGFPNCFCKSPPMTTWSVCRWQTGCLGCLRNRMQMVSNQGIKRNIQYIYGIPHVQAGW